MNGKTGPSDAAWALSVEVHIRELPPLWRSPRRRPGRDAAPLGHRWCDLCGPCSEAEHGPTVNAANHTPDAFARHLSAAQGYLELGLPHDGWNELEAIEPADRRAEVAVLGLRVAIFHALERWGSMAEVCRHLAAVQPGEFPWVMWLALATRHH